MSMNLESVTVPVLGKRKNTTDQCPSHELPELGEKTKEEESSGGERDCEEYREAKESGALEEGDDKEEEEDEPCIICKGKGHWHYFCPWAVEIPPCCGFPTDLPSFYEVWCKHCWTTKFEGETGDCANCGCESKMVRLKRCPFCTGLGHTDKTHKECLRFKETVTPENYPIRMDTHV